MIKGVLSTKNSYFLCLIITCFPGEIVSLKLKVILLLYIASLGKECVLIRDNAVKILKWIQEIEDLKVQIVKILR